MSPPAGIRDCRYLVTRLLSNNTFFDALCDHRLSASGAAALAREAAAVNPMLDLQLARHIAELSAGDATLSRLLEALEAVVDGPRVVPALSGLLVHENPRVRSKAALLVGKANRNAHWAGRQLSAADARVRANAIQALWGVDNESSRELFWEALQDGSARVAGNAALGLYLLGETRSIPALLHMAAHHAADLRATAAWCMGHTLDPRFLPPLATLLRDADTRVRQNALRAASRIRQRVARAESLPALQVALLAATRIDAQARRLTAAAAGPGWTPLKLSPTQLVVLEDGCAAAEYEVRPIKTPDALVTGFAVPRITGGADPLHAAIETALLACARQRRRTDTWTVLKYEHGSLGDVLRRLLSGMLLSHAGRNLVVIGNPDSLGVDAERVQMGAQAAGVAIHGIVPPGNGGDALAALSSATGGAFFRAPDLPCLSRRIEQLCLGLLHRYEIVYRTPAAQPAASVRLEVHTPQGSGAGDRDL